jgi:hypothetical protein
MRYLIFILSLLSSCAMHPVFAQFTSPVPTQIKADSGHYLVSKDTMTGLANGIYRLQVKNAIAEKLNEQYRLQLSDLRISIAFRDSAIKGFAKQIDLYRQNEEHYKQIVDKLTPDWYDKNKTYLWFAIGIGLGFYLTR